MLETKVQENLQMISPPSSKHKIFIYLICFLYHIYGELGGIIAELSIGHEKKKNKKGT